MQTGRRIAHYELLEKLGEGGMGVVYRARDTKLDRMVALKFLPAHLRPDEEAKARFVQEAKAASALDHANICTIHDISETEDGELYIVMAFYEGQTLGHRLGAEAFAVERCVDIGLQLARALQRAHEAGIVHRDLKPANVLVTDRGEVKLLDFGVAKLASSRHDLTRTGATVGTAGYMSPEQVDGGEVDARADLFSLGALLYELLSGRKAFPGETPIAAAVAVLQAEPPPLSETRPDTPATVQRVVEACLRKDRDERPASAADVVAALDGAAWATGVVARAPLARPTLGRGRWIGGALVVVAAVALVFVLTRPDDATSALDPDLIAVLPFSVAGSPELAYLGEGIVDLVSAKLDGAGSLTAVNPRVVIARTRGAGDLQDLETTRRVAVDLGAGRYVTGDLLEVAGRLTLSAYLHDTGDPDRAFEQASVEGSTEEVFSLLDGLVANLLASSMTEEVDRLRRLATLTTPSLAAAKEYLQGEKLMRDGLYRESAEAYDRAVALDSTFALAYYRKTIAADFMDAYDVRSSADRAYALSDVLAPRDRRLLEALQTRRNGRVDEATQILRGIVHDHPDDVETWVQLGEAIFHDFARRGGSTLEAIAPFSRALELEPGNLMARQHLARLYALFDSVDALAEQAHYFTTHAPGSDRAVEVNAMYAYLSGDTAAQTAVKDQLVGQPWFYHFYAVHSVSRFARDVHGAADILADRPAEDPYVMALVPSVDIARGRFRETDEYLGYLRSLNDPMWDVVEAFLLTSGTMPPDPVRDASLAERLAGLDPAGIHRGSFIPPYEDLTVPFAAYMRDYYLALLLIDLGRDAEARALLDEMMARDPFVGLGSLKRDAERSLEAELQVASGDRAGALATLRSMEIEIPHAATVWPIGDLGRARFLRAELEMEFGDAEMARRFYVGLDEPWSPWDTYFRPLLYERMGRLAEERGDRAEAILYYTRLVELWRDCDPEVVPQREAIEARLGALRAS